MLADLAGRLRAEARRTDHRRLLVVAGSPERTKKRLPDALDGADLDPARTTVIGDRDLWTCERLAPNASSDLLGTTREAVVIDAHTAIRPNALGRGVGAVEGGGLVVLVTPPFEEWPERRDAFDATMAVPPYQTDDVTGHVRRRLIETLHAHRGVAIVDVDRDRVIDDGSVDRDPTAVATDDGPAVPDDAIFPAAAYEACLTGDQSDALAVFEALTDPPQAIVLEADRGRGKSSVLGLSGAALAAEGRDVLLTAPTARNAHPALDRARALADRLGASEPTAEGDTIAVGDGQVRFEPIADATFDADVILVDEAAAAPVDRLTETLDCDAVAYATTLHGYEGTGRGFEVRFREHLDDSRHAVRDASIARPIRWAPADPIEVWLFHALALSASPAPDALVADATPETVTDRHLDAVTLAGDDRLLGEVLGLLALAHYRTEPDDVVRILDAPNTSVRALLVDGHVASVAVLAAEGGLSADWRERLYGGERIRGHMLPDVLTSQCRDPDAGQPTGERVMRIATHPAARREGLGTRLLDAIRADTDADWVGAGFGANRGLLAFWDRAGFDVIHCSLTRNDRSGEHSAIVIDGCTPAGERLQERHVAWFARRIGGVLGDPLDHLDPDLVAAVLAGCPATVDPDLSTPEWRVLAGAGSGQGLYDAAPRAFRRLVLTALIARSEPLDATDRRLLVGKALQGRSWDAVTDLVDVHARSNAMRSFGDAIDRLLADHAPDWVVEGRDRPE
ncbi:tRNA(Met) cytidine acetyltransferase TmcA [Halococcoides cellulosivorans]|uniref:tRNA(Met) cytidine acetyltransferase TmcA n=1 Tax=Halococcoides cellulosivorans TaxID=1679096 RepID=A0A2R4X4D9_9EURY|nr:tRNA(Met) cytidine acetyltransferase TmcA [Halococcoides cellulosivorans]AWB28660.1 tRNA(Met) cytidine acetyltransferase [Halococcoides cellulosivorans]